MWNIYFLEHIFQKSITVCFSPSEYSKLSRVTGRDTIQINVTASIISINPYNSEKYNISAHFIIKKLRLGWLQLAKEYKVVRLALNQEKVWVTNLSYPLIHSLSNKFWWSTLHISFLLRHQEYCLVFIS